MGGQQLHPGVRRAAARRRPAGRPVRPAAAVPDRSRRVHAGLARRRAGGQRRRADRRAAGAGTRRGSASSRPRWRSSWRRSRTLRERTIAIGAWTAIGAMALAFGPLIGGFISQHLHWGWIFFINVPVGIVAFAGGGHVGRRVSRPVRGAASGRPRPDQFGGRALRADVRADRGPRQGLDVRTYPRRLRARRSSRGRVRADRVPDDAPDGRDAPVPLSGVRWRYRHHDAVGLRDLRHLLLHLDLPADHPRLLADEGGPGVRADGAVHGAVRRAWHCRCPACCGPDQTVALGMAAMAVGLYLFSRLGAGATSPA